jgi:hypothetical protein
LIVGHQGGFCFGQSQGDQRETFPLEMLSGPLTSLIKGVLQSLADPSHRRSPTVRARTGHQPRRLSVLPAPRAGQTGLGPSCECPSARTIGVGLADHHTVALLTRSGAPSGPTIYTIRGDVTSQSPATWNGSWNGSPGNPTVLSAAAALSCVIGAGSGLKAMEHASCKRQVELVRGTCVTAGTKITYLGGSEWCS